MADDYKPKLTPLSTKLEFSMPPVCHWSHWERLRKRISKIEHVNYVRVGYCHGIEIYYSNESEYLATVIEVDGLLRYFNKARFAKPV